MGSDYDKGYRGEPGGNTIEYQQGVADQMYATPPHGAASTSETPSFVSTGPMMDTSGISAAASDFAGELRRNPIKTLAKTAVQLIVVPTIVGLVAAGFGQLSNSSPQTFFLVAAGVTFALMFIFVMSVLLGFAIAFALNVIALPFSLWRWLIGFGVVSAGLGFALATMANEIDAIALQQAIDYGLRGLLVGFFIGLFYRMLRGLHRRTRLRHVPAGRV